MPEKEVLLSLEGLKKLESELEHLRTVRRAQVAERIRQAREFGDLNENSEYKDAKEEQAFIEGRIMKLERMLRNARLIDEMEGDPETVGLGTTVRLTDLETQETYEYTIVGSTEADPGKNRISNESPVGKAVMGAKVGDIVEVMVPAGLLKFRIDGIHR